MIEYLYKLNWICQLKKYTCMLTLSICVCRRYKYMSKPIIGIVSKHFVKNGIRPNTYIRDEIKQAIFDNGA